jgi:hypothetical protein
MSEHLPYENELVRRLQELQLPAEDMAWEDMKCRLDKDNNDKPLIPPVTRGCAGSGILLLVLTIAFLFIIDPARWFHKRIENRGAKADTIENKRPGLKAESSNRPIQGNKTTNEILPKDTTNNLSQKGILHSTLLNDGSADKNKISKGKSTDNKDDKIQNGNTNKQTGIDLKNARQQRPAVRKTDATVKATIVGDSQADSVFNDKQLVTQSETFQRGNLKSDTTDVVAKTKTTPDSLKKNNGDTTSNKNETKSDSSTQSHLYFGVGLALHQLLPVAGQKSNPYNSLGRKSSLRDYIPAVYLRLYNSKKWFVQSEFRYGAPQYTKDVVYIPKKIIDTSGVVITSESKRVKKTFYNQLPVSFNYYVLPGLSVGTGITFNKFGGAIVQQEIHKTGVITQADTLVSSGLVSQKKADSNFVKTYMQALFETQFQWKRFSAGLRYSFGLQPYLKFTLPGGIQRREKNSSLQLFIRYELWQSRKKDQ